MLPLLILGALAVLMFASKASAASATPLPTPLPAQKHDCSDIKWVQASLNLLGYKAGPEDGFSGPLTQAAAQKFGGDHGIVPGPNADDLFCDALSRAVAARGK